MTLAWAIKWRSRNQLDGHREYLIGRYSGGLPDVPAHVGGQTLMLFKTRGEARDHVRQHYGYIKGQPDLRTEPHGWRVPIPVRVRVTVEEVGS